MAWYAYMAKSMDGRKRRGRIQAEDEQKAYQNMKAEGAYCIALKKIEPQNRFGQLSARYLSDFCGQLSTMLQSGITILEALQILLKKEQNTGNKVLYENIYQLLLKGNSLSEAMEQQEGAFPRLLLSMVHAGETGGRLDTVLKQMEQYYDREKRVKEKLVGALVYPTFLMVTTIAVIIVIFTMVLPSFFALFDTMEDLPAGTRILIWISNQVTAHGLLWLILLAMGVVLLVMLCQLSQVKLFLARLSLQIPVLGHLLLIVQTARISSGLSALYRNGVPLYDAVQIAGSLAGNPYLEFYFPEVLKQLENGIPLSAAMSAIPLLHKTLVDGIYIGEESGQLGSMLDRVSSGLEEEADQAEKRLITLIEPIMIILMAVLIGFVAISVMTPVYQYYQSVG